MYSFLKLLFCFFLDTGNQNCVSSFLLVSRIQSVARIMNIIISYIKVTKNYYIYIYIYNGLLFSIISVFFLIISVSTNVSPFSPVSLLLKENLSLTSWSFEFHFLFLRFFQELSLFWRALMVALCFAVSLSL